jgi:exonuclease III
MKELGYIDLMKYNPYEDSDRYTWYYLTETGFIIDYALVSSKLSQN